MCREREQMEEHLEVDEYEHNIQQCVLRWMNICVCSRQYTITHLYIFERKSSR